MDADLNRVAEPTPRVSVLMPVYNADRYLREAIESILGQTYRDFEFIIVDDGSTDGSLRIIEDYASRHPRIRVLSRPNTGIVGALNDGLAICGGEYIARMDADDVARPERIDRQVAFLQENRDVLAVGSHASMIDADGDPLGVLHTPLGHEEIDRQMLTGVGALAHPTVVMRRDSVVALGGYREGFCAAEDLDFFLRLSECGRLANLPDCLLTYRVLPNGISQSRSRQQAESSARAVEAAARRRGWDTSELALVTRPNEFNETHLACGLVQVARKAGFRRTAWKHLARVFWRTPHHWIVWCTLGDMLLPGPTGCAAKCWRRLRAGVGGTLPPVSATPGPIRERP